MTKETKDRFMFTLGGLIMIAFFVIIGLLIFYPTPEPNKDVLNLMLGSLIGMAGAVVGYFYGSSKGSSEKTDLLNKKQE